MELLTVNKVPNLSCKVENVLRKNKMVNEIAPIAKLPGTQAIPQWGKIFSDGESTFLHFYILSTCSSQIWKTQLKMQDLIGVALC